MILSACSATALDGSVTVRGCSDAPLTAGRNDFDIRATTLTVDLRLRGARIGAARESHGTLVFREQTGRSIARVALGRAAIEPFELLLADGSYDVEYEGVADCRDEPLPCIGGTVARSITVGDHPRAVRINIEPTEFHPAVSIQWRSVHDDRDVAIACTHGVARIGRDGDRSFEAIGSPECRWIYASRDAECLHLGGCTDEIAGPFALTPSQLRPTLTVSMATLVASLVVRSPTASAVCRSEFFPWRGALRLQRLVDEPYGTSNTVYEIAGRYAVVIGGECELDGQYFRLFHVLPDALIETGAALNVEVNLMSVALALEIDEPFASQERAVVFTGSGETSTIVRLGSVPSEQPTRAWIPRDTREALLLTREARFQRSDDNFDRLINHWSRSLVRLPTTPRENELFTVRTRAVVPRVAVSVNGAPVEDWSRWLFLFRPPFEAVRFTMGNNDVYGVYDSLSAGDYDVLLRPVDNRARDSLAAAGFPSHPITVAAQRLDDDGVVRVALSTMSVFGHVTVNGAIVRGSTFDGRFRSMSDESLEHSTLARDGFFEATLLRSDWRMSVSAGECGVGPRAEHLCGTVYLRGCASR